MSKEIVNISELSRRFGKTLALDNVSFSIQSGLVYGLVGGNGQGKTTLLRHLLGLYRAQSGTVRVFDQDPVKHPVSVLQRIGYLSEDREIPDWMRVDELLNYTAAYYPNWDHNYANQLVETFGLVRSQKIKNLSKGMRAQSALILAVAHRPDLLILDEPSTGLDPIVRKDILNEIVRAVADEGRTVIFSSHLLDEIELMSDELLMMEAGRIIMQGPLDELQLGHWFYSVRSEVASSFDQFPGVLSATQVGNDWNLVVNNPVDLENRLLTSNTTINLRRNATLAEIYVARSRRSQPTTQREAQEA